MSVGCEMNGTCLKCCSLIGFIRRISQIHRLCDFHVEGRALDFVIPPANKQLVIALDFGLITAGKRGFGGVFYCQLLFGFSARTQQSD